MYGNPELQTPERIFGISELTPEVGVRKASSGAGSEVRKASFEAGSEVRKASFEAGSEVRKASFEVSSEVRKASFEAGSEVRKASFEVSSEVRKSLAAVAEFRSNIRTYVISEFRSLTLYLRTHRRKGLQSLLARQCVRRHDSSVEVC